MFKSVKSLVYLSFLIVGLSLLLVIILGVRQYRLNAQYTQISSLSERTLFGFNTIRDQVTESIISGNYGELKSVVPDIEQLNSQVSKLYDYPMIPTQYKLAMADSIDLSDLVIDLRKLDAATDRTEAGLALQRKMRRIGENLIKVDRIITAHIRDSVIGFQLTVIGTMGILISCASFVLIVLYRKGVMPLLDLSRQAAEGNAGEQRVFQCSTEAAAEIREFVDSVNALLTTVQPSDENPSHSVIEPHILSKTVNETANNLNAVINYTQLLLESGPEDLTSEQREMLLKIVESGERISEQWQDISKEFDQ